MDESHTVGNEPQSLKSVIALAFGALGVVYGDIGTSPLYALDQTFFGHHALERTETEVLGALSLFFYSLTIVISIKYLVFILRADNQGEGGVFSELSIIQSLKTKTRLTTFVSAALIFGACLLYADGLITPAISVLSAVEGIEIITPALHSAVVPITMVILIGLFLIQRHGTGTISRYFGLIMVLWFLSLVAMAIPHLANHPEVFSAINPEYAVRFVSHHGLYTMLVLGSVVLCVTGGEALYADMGHFGRGPIRIAWFALVYPALVINYFGQGARLMDQSPVSENNLFYSLVPSWALLPMVVLATCATIIASQALISGAYSLTRQAIGLGFFPRMKIVHTSSSMHGQIYMPGVNWLLLIGCLSLVVGFKSSTNLGAAYGIAVTGTMAVTTFGFYVVATENWGWNKWWVLPICAIFILIDTAFFVSNSLKFIEGGFVPIVIAFGLFFLMKIWNWGRIRLANIYTQVDVALEDLLALKGVEWQGRIPSRISFFTPLPVRDVKSFIPLTLQTFISRYHVLPQGLTFITVNVSQKPYEEGDRVQRYELPEGIVSYVITYGFMEEINLIDILKEAGLSGNILVGEHEIFTDHSSAYHNFKTRFFRQMLRISQPTHRYFGVSGQSKIMKEILPVEFAKDKTVLLDVDV